MKLNDLLNARNNYNYPSGHIKVDLSCELTSENLKPVVPNSPDCFSSSLSLDNYHNNLLISSEKESVNLGIVSVQYWGRCFVKGRVNHSQALVRAKWLLDGNAKSNKNILNENIGFETVKKLIGLTKENRIGDAFWELKSVPHLGVSFGSKLLAFINPEKVGVYDSHIARYLVNNIEQIKLLCHEVRETDTILKSPQSFRVYDKHRFENYCNLLQLLAAKLNQMGISYQWTDWDNTKNDWRAIDVERALFVLAQREQK